MIEDNRIYNLNREIEYLQEQLNTAKQTIADLRESIKNLKEQLCEQKEYYDTKI